MDASDQISKISCSGKSRAEIAMLLQPVIELHGIEVKDNRFEFIGISPCVGVPESEVSDEEFKAVIPFVDICFISDFTARIEVLLQSGELYTFSKTENIRTHINTYTEGTTTKPGKPTTSQDVARNIWEGLEEKLNKEKKK